MVFQCVAGAKQLGLFAVLMIVGNFRVDIKVVMAELKPCGAYCCPVGGLLLFFLRGEGIG